VYKDTGMLERAIEFYRRALALRVRTYMYRHA
jgi:hypothetical protein